jgi:hypothetical protein
MPAMDYGVLDYGDMNWLAVFCAGLAYWLWARSGIRPYLVRCGDRQLKSMASRFASQIKPGWG